MDLFSYVPPEPKRYPDVPGFKEGTTSKDAADAIKSRVGRLRDRALEIIRKSPSTADEVAFAMGETVLAIRPRITELRSMGKIEKAGLRRENASGCKAHVWRVVP